MPWFRVDDDFPEHRKVLALGELEPLAIALWLKAGCLSNRSLLEGRIPLRSLRGLLDLDGYNLQGEPIYLQHVVDALVRVGLWHLDGETVVFHDYHDKQPTRKKVLADRAAGVARKAAHRVRLASASREASPENRGGPRVGLALASVPPVPVPVPIQITDPPLPPTGGAGGGTDTGNQRIAALEVVSLWNRFAAPKLGEGRIVNSTPGSLGRIIRALRDQPDLAWWEALCRRVGASAWCAGKNDRAFVVDLWWVLEKRLEVASGRYDDRESRPTKATTVQGVAKPRSTVHVIDPDYRGAEYRFPCPHTPSCTTWPQCRDLEAQRA